ncbi:hypothetical protein [Clostridium tertium]|uniref:hypothetical protein n=1 Tax=Clostridium tertium TaxID=1559 RepID=UPI002A83776F|nr:hypothetical protein [Clostridium tertium]MDY3359624.1 hypothetical protein [Clostridium celatum]MDY4606010.1 hypothetical protein [Clostridium tertium]
MKRGNKIIIGIVAIVAFIVIGSIGKSNNEVKVIINKAKEYLNNGEISEAENVLRAKAGETSNREFKKLWSIVYGYRQAENDFSNDNLDGAKQTISKIDNSYKDYNIMKEKIESLELEIKELETFREEFDDKLKKIEKLMDNGDYYTAQNLMKETITYGMESKEQGDKFQQLKDECKDKLLNEDIRIEAVKICDDKFNLQKANEYAQNMDIDREIYEVSVGDEIKYTSKGFKYVDIAYKVKGTNEINRRGFMYSNGFTEENLSGTDFEMSSWYWDKEKENQEKENQEKQEKEKIESEFNKEIAQKIIDKFNANNGNSRNFYEITSDLKIDDNGKKYFEIVAKDKDWIKFDDHTILAYYRLYSNEELVEVQN